jgi:hypothetical protein
MRNPAKLSAWISIRFRGVFILLLCIAFGFMLRVLMNRHEAAIFASRAVSNATGAASNQYPTNASALRSVHIDGCDAEIKVPTGSPVEPRVVPGVRSLSMQMKDAPSRQSTELKSAKIRFGLFFEN